MTSTHTDENCKDNVPQMVFGGFGRAYVPDQVLCELYPAKEGFVRGTIFPELDIPYESRWNIGTQAKEVSGHA